MEIQIPDIWHSLYSCLFEPDEISDTSQVPAQFLELSSINVPETRLAVFGGKGVGKSTFNKWLINKLLDNVVCASTDDDDPFILFIDLDPGQAEFTPPGVISVVRINDHVRGPNHSHLAVPILSKYLGSINVSECAQTYLRCVKEIVDFLNADDVYKKVPWVINTMGFCRGLGVALACKIICLVNPNAVVQIGVNIPGEDRRTFPWQLTAERVRVEIPGMMRRDNITASALTTYQFISIDSVFNDLLHNQRKDIWSIPARQQRNTVLISYFASIFENTDDNNIAAVIPRIVPMSSVALATMTRNNLSYDDVLRAMNGNLIALCHLEDIESEQQQLEHKFIRNASGRPNKFYGYGILRSIDPENKLLYVLTPVAEEFLANINCFMTAGTIELPIQLYLQAAGPDNEAHELPFVMSKRKSKSRLNQAAKKQFVPNRVAHTVLQNCLL